MQIVAVTGFNKGKTILKKMPAVLAPSILAASSSSFGIVERINPAYKKNCQGHISRRIIQYRDFERIQHAELHHHFV